jgi:hypothetical protein
MSRQGLAVSGGFGKRNQNAELNARLRYLPQYLANKNRADDIARENLMHDETMAQRRAEFGEQQRQFSKTQAANRRSAQVGAGLEAGKLGLTVGKNFMGKTLGDFSKSVAGKNYLGAAGNFDIGSAATGGLLGFGAGALLPTKNKYAKAGIGAAAGALGSFLGGGSVLSGGGGGLLGGLLGGLFK